MKMILALVGCVALTILSVCAQDSTEESTNSTPTPTSTPAESDGGTNEVTIEDLMKLPSFTNETGMVMVKLSGRLWVGAYEVTQAEYQKVAGSNPSRFQSALNPVESVTWNEAVTFCEKLTAAEVEKKMLPEGFAYSLPTQAQWESFAAGVQLKDAVTSNGLTRSGTASVGTLGASGAGLYDVRGNVCEWCLDPQNQPYRVARGAAWNTFIEINLRPEFRWYEEPVNRRDKIGFRVVLATKSGT